MAFGAQGLSTTAIHVCCSQLPPRKRVARAPDAADASVGQEEAGHRSVQLMLRRQPGRKWLCSSGWAAQTRSAVQSWTPWLLGGTHNDLTKRLTGYR